MFQVRVHTQTLIWTFKTKLKTVNSIIVQVISDNFLQRQLIFHTEELSLPLIKTSASKQYSSVTLSFKYKPSVKAEKAFVIS